MRLTTSMQQEVDRTTLHLAFAVHLCGHGNTMHAQPTPPLASHSLDNHQQSSISILTWSLSSYSISSIAHFRTTFLSLPIVVSTHCTANMHLHLHLLSLCSFGFLVLAISYGNIKTHQHTHPHPSPHHYHPQYIVHQILRLAWAHTHKIDIFSFGLTKWLFSETSIKLQRLQGCYMQNLTNLYKLLFQLFPTTFTTPNAAIQVAFYPPVCQSTITRANYQFKHFTTLALSSHIAPVT